MLAAQTLACDTIKAGVPCSAVDKAVNRYFAENDLGVNLAAPLRSRQIDPDP